MRMPKPIHVLNGDALAERFPAALPGERLVFRECLIDGPIRADGPEALQRMRNAWLSKTYGIAASKAAAMSKPCYEGLEALRPDRPIYLWFEDDLFCQVNAWYVVHRLRQRGFASAFWVRPDTALRYGFGGMDTKALKQAYRKAKALDHQELDLLSALWWMFRNGRSESLQTLAQSQAARLPWLPTAAQSAQALLEDGPKGPRRQILGLVQELGPDADFGSVFRAFAHVAPEFGLGDLQVHRYWHRIMTDLRHIPGGHPNGAE
jgi:hypothetical protein